MSSEPSEEKITHDQIEALLDLLPRLKAELRFAGCDDNALLLSRIEQVYCELKRVQAEI